MASGASVIIGSRGSMFRIPSYQEENIRLLIQERIVGK